ncbi:MAG: hypothetical protein M0036_00480 [Desulfobacteraceae bacterium]|nr:hypothetical protein [Desulfobacteraceae bacterium]
MLSRCSKKNLILIGAVYFLSLLMGCASTQEVTAPSTPSPVTGPEPSAPIPPKAVISDWTTAHSGAFYYNREPVFFGIGQASGMNSATLLRATADNQAQTEMARVLKIYFGRLISASGWQAEQEEKQLLINNLSQTCLQKARIVDHRFDERGKRLQALCNLSLQSLNQTIETFPHLNRALKQELLNRSQSIHQQMATGAQ